MAFVGKKINVEDLKIGDVFEFEYWGAAVKFEGALYAQARKKGFNRPIFEWEITHKNRKTYHSLKVDSFKLIKTRVK